MNKSYPVLRNDPTSYLLGAIAIGISVCAFAECFSPTANSWDEAKLGLLFFSLGAFWCIWVGSFRLQITDQDITFGRLFRPARTIRFSDILKARNVSGFVGNSTSLDGMNRILIWDKRSPENPYIVINLKPFRGKDVALLLSTLKPYMHSRPHL